MPDRYYLAKALAWLDKVSADPDADPTELAECRMMLHSDENETITRAEYFRRAEAHSRSVTCATLTFIGIIAL